MKRKQNRPKKPGIASSFDVSLYNLDVTLSPVGNTAELHVSVDETIGHYADWLGIPTYRIRKLNDMGRTSDIRLNKRLLIPNEHQDALEKFVAARLEYHMAIEEDFYAQYRVADLKKYVIKRGQTLWDLCNETENPIPLWLFKKHNKQLDLGKLIPGMTVWIPVIEEGPAERTVEPAIKNPGTLPTTYTRPINLNSYKVKRVP